MIQLGGPGMLIGLGGGAASSMDTGTNQEDLDFDSVQRGNAEIERRAQEVIDRCWGLGEAIRSCPYTTSAQAGFPTRCPSSCTRRAAAAASTCAKCRTTSPACRRCRSGATRRRSVMSLRSRPSGSAAVQRNLRARALSLCRGGGGDRRRPARRRRSAFPQQARRHGA